jgi:hypothetical protein
MFVGHLSHTMGYMKDHVNPTQIIVSHSQKVLHNKKNLHP